MKSTVETLSPTRVRLAVELPFAEIQDSFSAAYKKIGAQVRVPGFRPGKVPGRVLEQRLGRPVILEEVVNHAVPRAYDEAVRSNAVRALGRPEIEVTAIDDGDQIAFTAEVDVRPELDLPEMSTLSATVDDLAVSDEEVDEQVEALRERFAALVAVDRPAAAGDVVTLDIVTAVDGEDVPDGRAEGLTHEIGSGQLIAGLDEAVTGLSAGESATFATTLSAGGHAGAGADVTVSVRTVKARQLEELTDEFAQTVSEFDTLDELREDSRNRLRQVKQVEQGTQARDALLEALLEQVDVPLPEALLDREVEWRRHSLEHQLGDAGADLAGYLAEQEQTEEEFTAELRDNATTAVRTQFILDTYADREEIGVSEQDLTQHIVLQARRYRMAPDAFAQQLTESGQLAAVVADVRRNKVLAMLLDAATVQDRSGAAVDLSALRRGFTDAESDVQPGTGNDGDASDDGGAADDSR